MKIIQLEIKDNAVDKVMYLLEHLDDDVKIVESSNYALETIGMNEQDYQDVLHAREQREQGEATYNIDKVIKDFQ